MPASARAVRSSGTATALPAALAKAPRFAARSSNDRSAETQNPRPGNFASTSGTTLPDGSSTKRSSLASGKISPVTIQRLSREPPIETASAVMRDNSAVGYLLHFGLFRRDILGLHPARVYTRLHDDG